MAGDDTTSLDLSASGKDKGKKKPAQASISETLSFALSSGSKTVIIFVVGVIGALGNGAVSAELFFEVVFSLGAAFVTAALLTTSFLRYTRSFRSSPIFSVRPLRTLLEQPIKDWVRSESWPTLL